jgi:vesicle transport protein SEC22
LVAAELPLSGSPLSGSPFLADTFIQKTKKLYLDTRTQRNISKLNADIAEVHSIMTRNIQDVLGQGERLDREFSKRGGGGTHDEGAFGRSAGLCRGVCAGKWRGA